MGREIKYDDAVRILGGDSGKFVRLIDGLIGVSMLALVFPFQGVLGWFDAKAELTKLVERMISALSNRGHDLSRYDRTQQLEAAHALIATVSFFEGMAELDLPLTYQELRITAEDQLALTRKESASKTPGAPVPGPAEPHEEFLRRLEDHYDRLSLSVLEFIQGLAPWDQLDETQKQHTIREMRRVSNMATRRYDGLVCKLAAEFPEVAFWSSMREHNAAYEKLRDISTALSTLGESLGSKAVRSRGALGRAYADYLNRPIADAGEAPAGLILPSLGEAFLPQLFRASQVDPSDQISSDNWWDDVPLRDDLFAFLSGHLTSASATVAPLMVLGQPGSGKSVLVRILAAKLPAADFLPVLVSLRSVPAAGDLQQHIEYAVRAETAEAVEWPELVNSSGGALPLVLLDGFDEFLQATGLSQTDYLEQVAAFQRKQAVQGRPLAVVVTSRVSVANRARPPIGTAAIRLEPFDESRVASWVRIWNRVNAAYFSKGAESPLDLAIVLRHPDLCSQPLLLLMLALYDAEGNALNAAGPLRTDQLYEKLLVRFAGREVDKLAPGLTPRERSRRVESELRRLSVIAFAMFNRGAQWVSEDQLEKDLRSLPVLASYRAHTEISHDRRVPLRASELAIGSFFFVHRARANQNDIPLSTYEFLHATFGEFLIARLLRVVLDDLLARFRAAILSEGVDDGLLEALLSTTSLASRKQVIAFLKNLMPNSSGTESEKYKELLELLFRNAPKDRQRTRYPEYRPLDRTVPERVAQYSANLFLLRLCVSPLYVRELFQGKSPDQSRAYATSSLWVEQCLMWRSQLPRDFYSLMEVVSVKREICDETAEVKLSLALNEPSVVPNLDMRWWLALHEVTEGGLGYGAPIKHFKSQAHFIGDFLDAVIVQILHPIAELVEDADNVHVVGIDREGSISQPWLVAFMRVITSADGSSGEVGAAYYALATEEDLSTKVRTLILRHLSLHEEVDPSVVAGFFQILLDAESWWSNVIDITSCALAHWGSGEGEKRDVILQILQRCSALLSQGELKEEADDLLAISGSSSNEASSAVPEVPS